MKYLMYRREIVAAFSDDENKYKNNSYVTASFQRCKEGFNANKEWNLVNAFHCRVSIREPTNNFPQNIGCEEIAEGEFFLRDLNDVCEENE